MILGRLFADKWRGAPNGWRVGLPFPGAVRFSTVSTMTNAKFKALRAAFDAFSKRYVRIHGVRAYVSAALSLLSVVIEDEGSITADLLDFPYVLDSSLRAIQQRDYRKITSRHRRKMLEGRCRFIRWVDRSVARRSTAPRCNESRLRKFWSLASL